MNTTTATDQQQLIKAPRKLTRDLPCKLTEPEYADIAREIGRLNKKRDEMSAQAKMAASAWKDRISGLDAQISDLAERAETGVIDRPVPCEEITDYRLQEVRVVRLDTGEPLERRPMTQQERQPELFSSDAGEDEPVEPGTESGEVASATATDGGEEGALPGLDDDGLGTAIADPQAVLDGAVGEPAAEAKPRRRKPR